MQIGKVIPKSSNIQEYAYDGKDLLVLFKSGKSYRYLDVRMTLFADMMKAKSAGTFLNQNVKPQYNCEEITDTDYANVTASLSVLTTSASATFKVLPISDYSKFLTPYSVCF